MNFLLRVLLVLSLGFGLSACAPDKKTNKSSITVWHWMTDRDGAFQELAKRYEINTGIRVNFELYAPSDAYSQKVRAAAQGNTLPDIFGVLGEKRDFSSFIKAGFILDLTPYMEENNGYWKNSFFPQALAVTEFTDGNSYGIKPGFYGVPIDVMTIQMLYNKDLFKKLGLNPDQPPVTVREFLDIGAKISAARSGGSLPARPAGGPVRQAGAYGGRSSDIQGLVSGWGELWMIDCFANNYAFNIMGKEKVLATIQGAVPYTDPDWIKVLVIFKDMKESGVLSSGVVTMVNKTAEQLFASGKAVFAFNGSWCVNVYKGMNPDLNYAVMLPPKASDQFPMAIWGGAGSSFMVNARSRNMNETVRFLQWFTAAGQQTYLSGATNNLPANKQSAANMPEINTAFARGMDYAIHPNAWGVSEFSMVIETWNKGIQSIILGEKTPEKVAAETQAVKEREMARMRKINMNKKGVISGTSS